MCEECVKTFKDIPPDVIQKLGELEFKFHDLVQEAVPVFKAAFGMRAMDAESGLPIEEADLTEEEEKLVYAQMDQLIFTITSSYMLGWYLTVNKKNREEAEMFDEPMVHMINKATEDALAAIYVRNQRSN